MTSGADAVLLLYDAITEAEQEEVYRRLQALRLDAIAATEDNMERCLRSLKRVRDVVGGFPNTRQYRQTSQQLIASGEDLEPFARVYSRFDSWQQAREAVELVETTPVRRVEARFKQRRRGRPYRFTNDLLIANLQAAGRAVGGAPTREEFLWWRRGQLEAANARGEHHLFVPSVASYRRRWPTWAQALRASGFAREEVAERLGRRRMTPPKPRLPDPTVLNCAEMLVAELDRAAEQAALNSGHPLEALAAVWGELPERTRLMVVLRLGVDGDPLPLPAVGQVFDVTAERVGQLHREAVRHLAAELSSVAPGVPFAALADQLRSALAELLGSESATRPHG